MNYVHGKYWEKPHALKVVWLNIVEEPQGPYRLCEEKCRRLQYKATYYS